MSKQADLGIGVLPLTKAKAASAPTRYPRGHVTRYDVEELLEQAQRAAFQGLPTVSVDPVKLRHICEKWLDRKDE